MVMEVEETGWRRWWLGRWRGKGAVVAREVVARAEEATLGAGRGDGAVVREVGAALASGAMVEGELKAAAVMAVTAQCALKRHFWSLGTFARSLCL